MGEYVKSREVMEKDDAALHSIKIICVFAKGDEKKGDVVSTHK